MPAKLLGRDHRFPRGGEHRDRGPRRYRPDHARRRVRRGGPRASTWPTADALILFHEIALVGAATFSRAPRCKCIIRAGVGYNNVDRAAAAKHGVIVCNVPDYGTEEVADHAIMFLLALARKLLPSDAAIRAGGWDYRTAIGTPRLRGRTLGLVGCGRIGTATALRAKAFGLDVVFYDPLVPQGVDKALGIRRVFRLEELLEQSHFVSLHCYLDQTTHHLIDARALARMRPERIPDQHGARAGRRPGRAARGARFRPARRRRARRRRARAARRRPPPPSPPRDPDPAFGVLQRRGVRRAADQGRRGSPPHPAGRAAAESGHAGQTQIRRRIVPSVKTAVKRNAKAANELFLGFARTFSRVQCLIPRTVGRLSSGRPP